MRTHDRLSILLIESDETSRGILLGAITAEFPSIDVMGTTTPDEALRLLRAKEHDIVVCDALLARDERIRFTWHMCTEADPVIIIITADTDVQKDSFPPVVKELCVQHVTYKPLMLDDLMQKIADAIKRVEVRKEMGTGEVT